MSRVRGELERIARRAWGRELGWKGALFGAATVPLEWVWALALRAHEHGFARRPPTRFQGILVVSVGNLAVGGTGKTPLARWMADRLEQQGVPTAILVGDKGDDEALLHRWWRPGRVVIVERDRVEGARLARAAGARALVLDDGFQHRRLARDVDVVLLSADDPFPGPLLPRGPYREPARALARAGAVVVTRRRVGQEGGRALARRADAYAPGKVLAGACLAPSGWRRLDGGEGAPERGGVLALSAVARADAFARALEELLGGPVELRTYADHYAFGAADVRDARARARGRPIVVTEKDAVKLARWVDELRGAYVLCEELRWDWGEETIASLLASALAGAGAPSAATASRTRECEGEPDRVPGSTPSRAGDP
jgi:tetraacyldisaccharide 4'-kinase